MKRFFPFFIIFIFGQHFLTAQNNLSTKTIATNLDTPWEILWGPDNYIWITERYGKVSRVNPFNGTVQEVVLIGDVSEVGEGGLLGMVLDPDFSANHFFYVAYNYSAQGNVYKEKIVRYTYNPSTGKATNPAIIFDNIPAANNHNGCRMVISPGKKLVFTTGDAQVTSYSQDISRLNGKILRINLDGTIPSDNPQQNSPVWSWGHRNPQGLVYSPDGKNLYSSEHGPSNDDELNIILKGRNYGWPSVAGFCDNTFETGFCSQNNVVEPIFAWTPTLAVAGIDFYNSDLIPEWKNSILIASLKASRITQIKLSETGTSVLKTTDFFTGQFGRLRDICISPEGKVYIAVSNRDGRGTVKTGDDKIIEISPLSTTAPEINKSGFISVSPNPGSDVFIVTFAEELKTKTNYVLYNTLGQIIKSGYLGPKTTKIDLGEVNEGMVFLQIDLKNRPITKKILIKR